MNTCRVSSCGTIQDDGRDCYADADAINGMLNHQIEFSKSMTEIYKPISGRMSDPDSMKIEGNPEGIRACEEYEAVVKDLQETLAPELEMIESRIIRPANELLDVVKVIRKTATKREHKKLDYDRHRTTLKKLQEKKEKTMGKVAAWAQVGSGAMVVGRHLGTDKHRVKKELPRIPLQCSSNLNPVQLQIARELRLRLHPHLS